jgi:hypothetical protein
LEPDSARHKVSHWEAILNCWPDSHVESKHDQRMGRLGWVIAPNTQGWSDLTRLQLATH